MKAITGVTRSALLGFCASHIVFTVVLDGQSIARALYPQPLQDFSAWYVATFNDPLMAAAPGELLWFQSLICCEIVVQLPFFFSACYYFGNHDATSYPDWFRSYCLIYGAHTATTMVPILTTLATTEKVTANERYVLLSFYLPYLFFPLWILYIAATSSTDSAIATRSKKTA